MRKILLVVAVAMFVLVLVLIARSSAQFRVCEGPKGPFPCYVFYSRTEVAFVGLGPYLEKSALADPKFGLAVVVRSLEEGLVEVTWYQRVSR